MNQSVPVSIDVASILSAQATRSTQLNAARGLLPLTGVDLLTALAFLCANPANEVKQAALRTLRTLPPDRFFPALEDPSLHPRLLDLLVRLRMADRELVERVVSHPAVSQTTLLMLAQCTDQPDVLTCLVDTQERLGEAVVATLLANPHLDQSSRSSLVARRHMADTARHEHPEEDDVNDLGEFPTAVDGDPAEVEDVSDEHVAALLKEAEDKGVSKYQLAMDLKVSEKIKLAMTGDKEWRKILIKDPNKLVHGAVLKNGRVTDGEVLMVAKNKSSSDEMVRLILLNRDWIKHYEMRKALVAHPKTPLAKALRFVSELNQKDLKEFARSRNVSSIIVSAARRELLRKTERRG